MNATDDRHIAVMAVTGKRSSAGHEVHFATLAYNLALSQVDFLITWR
jgi:hypothetical protein